MARVDTTPIGEGMAAMGKAAMQLGASLGKDADAEAERRDAYEAEKRILQFTNDQTRRLHDEQQQMPQGGTGFADGFASSYDQAARDLFRRAQEEGLSPRALQRLDIGLLRSHEHLRNRANVYEDAERGRAAEFELQELLSASRGNVRTDPNRLNEERERGRIMIDGHPNIPQRQRYSILRSFERQIQEEALQAMRERVRTPEDLRRFNEWAAANTRVPGGQTRRGPTPDAFQPGGGAPRTAPPAQSAPRSPGEEAGQPGPLDRSIRRARGINDRGPRPSAPSHIVLHHTGGTTVDSAEATHARTGYAYHYYILPDGSVEQRHGDDRVIAHAGTIDRNRTGATNENSVGIAFVAPDDGAITPEQRATARWFVPQVASQNRIPASNIWGHREGGATNPLTGRRTSGEGDMAREFREGTIPMQVAAAPAATQQPGQQPATPRGVGAPRVPIGSLEDRSGDAGYAADPAVTGASGTRPMYVGSEEWIERVLDEEDRNPGTTARSNLPNVSSSRLRSEARGAAGQVRQTRNDIISKIKAWEKGAMEGLSPGQADIAQMREMVDSFNDGSEEGLQVAEYFNSITGYPDGRKGLIQRVDELRSLHPVQLQKEILAEELRQRRAGTTEADQRLLRHMKTLLQNTQSAINQDTNSWMASAGHSPAPAQLDYRDDATMQARAALAQRNGELLRRPAMYFSPIERDAIRDQFRRGDPEILPMLGSIMRNFGTAGINELLQRGEDGQFRDPELVAAAGIVVNSQRSKNPSLMRVAEDLVAEIHLRNTDASYRESTAALQPTREESRGAREFIGRTFAATPTIENAALAATDLLYTRWARESKPTVFDDKKYRELFMQVMGQNMGDAGTTNAQHTYGGIYVQPGRHPIPVPSNIRNDPPGIFGGGMQGMELIREVLRVEDLRAAPREDRSGDAGYAADPAAQGQRLGPTGTDARGAVHELNDRDLRGARWQSIGSSRYILDTANDPRAPRWARAPRGGPSVSSYPGGDPRDDRFVLDLNALDSTIRERVPEVYRDYRIEDPPRTRGLGVPGPFGAHPVWTRNTTFGPDHPDYPKGQFAPQVNPGRTLTFDEFQAFEQDFRARHPTDTERRSIMSSQSRYWKELQQYIDRLPAATPPASR